MPPFPCILRTDDNLPTQPLGKCGVAVQIRLISAGPASKSVLSAYHVPVLEREPSTGPSSKSPRAHGVGVCGGSAGAGGW